MKFRHYTIVIIQVIVFVVLISLFYYHNTIKLNTVVERMDRISDSIYTEIKTHPGQLFIPNTERQKDIKGNYWLSEQDFEILEKALLYHNKRAETICVEVRNEIASEMTNLNSWVTLWMGILAVLGVFVPIVINIASVRSIEKEIENQNITLGRINNEATEAKSNADVAKKMAEKSETLVNETNDIATRLTETTKTLASKVKDYQSNFAKVQSKAYDAARKSQTAEESILGVKNEVEWARISIRLVYSLGALKDIENSYRIAYHLTANKNFIVKHNIDDAILIFEDFKIFNENLGIDPQRNKLIKSVMSDFVLAFQKMQTFFNDREQLDAINEINNALTSFLRLGLQPNDDRANALQSIIDALSLFKNTL